MENQTYSARGRICTAITLAGIALAGLIWLISQLNTSAGNQIVATLVIISIICLVFLTIYKTETANQSSQCSDYFIEKNKLLEEQLNEVTQENHTLEHYFSTLMEEIPANIYFKDLDSRFLKVNQSLAKTFDCGHPTDLLGKADHDFFNDEHADKALKDEKQILASGKKITGQVELETFSNGRHGWVLTTKMPFRDRNGRIIGTFGMSSDVTELIEVKNTLERERNMLRSLIDSFPDKIFVRNACREYTLVNKALAEWVGAETPDAMLGKTPDEFYAEDVVQLGSSEDSEILSTGNPIINREWKYKKSEDDIRIMLTTKVPLLDEEGRSWGIVGMDRDITTQRKTREDLLIANSNLQHAQEQLIQAEKMESIGRLASGVAHEVKNPLAMIGMGIELLSKRIPENDDTGQDTIERMKRGINRAKKIVEGLVNFSSARQLTRELKDINLVISDAISLNEYQFRKANIHVVQELAKDLPAVKLDATKVEQVLVNLMINSQHAMPDGGTLTIRSYATQLEKVIKDEGARTADHLREGDGVIRIEIDDTGSGFEEKHANQIFDPFFTTKPTGVGTGLGLSVSRKIIELHEGTLALTNLEAGGVRASITLKIPETSS